MNINSKSVIVANSIGFLSAIFISMGWLGTMLSITYGNMIFSIGVILFTLFYLPYMLISIHRKRDKKSRLWEALTIIGSFSGLLIGFSVLFKFFHFTGADVFLIAGISLFSFGFLPIAFIIFTRRHI